jgi:hypothetical protein
MTKQLTLGVVAALTVAVAMIGPVGAGGPVQTTHHGTGRVVAVSPAEITLAEPGGRHPMAVDSATAYLIDEDARVSQIGIGDYVAEECVADGKGGVTAMRITLYRAAWMENASPEN